MGFITNALEDYESFLVKIMMNKRLLEVRMEEDKLRELQQSLDYRKTDVIFLTQKGFEYNKGREEFIKVEDFKHGMFPGKYRIKIKFPNDYPRFPPDIYCIPLHSRKVSQHILNRISGRICVSQHKHGSPGSYWKSNMNAKGALILAYHLITNEIQKEEDNAVWDFNQRNNI